MRGPIFDVETSPAPLALRPSPPGDGLCGLPPEARRGRGEDGGLERLRETKAEIARLRKQGNEAPEAQAALEAAAAALARPDIADLAAAQEALTRARARWLEGRARLAAAPEDEERLRDVSVILERVGDVRLAEGDRAGALEACEEGLAIRRGLVERDPGNAEWARDVVVSLAKMAQANEARAADYWAEAVERVEDMNRRGVLAPVDVWMLEDTKAQLAKARAR